MKLNIQRFAEDAWALNAIFSDYKYNTTGRLIQVTLKITSNYNIGSVYDIDSEDNENWAYSLWNVHNGVGTYPYSEAPYIERTFYNLNDLKGVKVTTYETSSTQNKTITYNFEMDASGEEEKTTYITKTSATAVLRGNVLNDLSTYDWNNAPSVAAVRNYLESSAVLHQSDIQNILLAAHPVGSIEINITGVNPSTYLGGTWEAFGSGRTLIGVGTGTDSNNTSQTFSSSELSGGEYTHQLITSEIPSHTHGSKSLVGTWANWGEGSGQVSSTANGYKVTGIVSAVGDNNQYGWGTSTGRDQDNTSLKIDATHEHNSVGGDGYHNNIQPYITVYFWKRTA